MISGGQCVIATGTALMLLWSASSWDMRTQDVSPLFLCGSYNNYLPTSMYTATCRWKAIQQCSLWCWQWTNLPGLCPVHFKF